MRAGPAREGCGFRASVTWLGLLSFTSWPRASNTRLPRGTATASSRSGALDQRTVKSMPSLLVPSTRTRSRSSARETLFSSRKLAMMLVLDISGLGIYLKRDSNQRWAARDCSSRVVPPVTIVERDLLF